MPVIKLRKLPVEIEAIQWTGDNLEEILNWVNEKDDVRGPYEGGILEVFEHTKEEWLDVKIGEYIIKGVSDELYPCSKKVLDKSYAIID